MIDPGAPQSTTYDFFISYSRSDEAIADKVCAALEAAGFRCWMAPRNIVPGMTWSAAIVEAIDLSRAMILIFSASANQSPQVQREVDGAVSRNMPVLPMRIEDVLPTGSMAYFLKAVHWLNAFTPPIDGHLPELTEAAKRLLSRTARTSPAEGLNLEAAQTAGGSRGEPTLQAPPLTLGTFPAKIGAPADNTDAPKTDATVSADEDRTGQTGKGDGRPFRLPLLLPLGVLGVLVIGGIAVYLMLPASSPQVPKLQAVPPAEVVIRPPADTMAEWVSFAPGTRIMNPSFTESIPTYADTDRSSLRSIDIKPRQTIPISGSTQLLAHRKVGSENWIRFPVGEGSGYVPEASIETLNPR